MRNIAVLLWLAVWSVAGTTCRGQEAPEPPTSDASPAAAESTSIPFATREASDQAAPDVYYLPDGKGGLLRVLGFQYEDFWNAWKALRDQVGTPQPPAFAVQQIHAVGKEEGNKVSLRFEIEVALLNDGWVRAPLDLGELILQQATLAARDDGPAAEAATDPADGGATAGEKPLAGDGDLAAGGGAERRTDTSGRSSAPKPPRELVLSFNQQDEKLEVWIRGKASTTETIVLEGILPVSRKANQKTIELKLPAPVLADVHLEVDGPITSIEGIDQAGVTTTRTGQGRTVARLVGTADKIRANWRRNARRQGEQIASLEAIGQLAVDIAMDRIVYGMRFDLNVFGQELSRVQIALPPGSALTGSEGPYEVATISTEDRAATIVEVRFAEPTADPPPIELRYETADLPGIEPAERQISAPRVIDAYRQHGVVALSIDPRLQAYFETTGPVEQIARTELPAALRSEAPTAAFAYAGVDWSLTATTEPQELRVRVEPVYRLDLRNEQAELAVELDYQVTGGRIFEILVDLAGWSLADVPLESGGRIDQARVVETSDGLLRLPLRDAVDDSLSIDLTLRRPAELGTNSWPLPTARDAVVAPGRLIVESRPALRVVPLANGLIGLAQLERSGTASSATKEAPLEFETFASDLRFSAELSRREQQVAVEVAVDAQVTSEACELVERFAFQILFEPLRQAEFVMPRELWEAGGLRWELDGQPLPNPSAIANPPAGSAANTVAVLLEFPQPLLGEVQLVLRYATAVSLPDAQREVAEVAPLVMPRQPIERVEATVWSSGLYEVGWSPLAAQLGWTIAAENPANAGGLLLSAADAATRLPLEIRPTRPQARGRLSVEKAWVQTWQVARQRQDRTVYALRTSRDSFVVELPSPILRETPIEVLIDGTPSLWEEEGPSRIRVPLPPASEAEALAEHVVEFRIRTVQSPGVWDRLYPVVPRLIDADGQAITYWQLVLPGQYAALTTPRQMSADYWLGWSNYRWGRQPTRSSDDLERWIGAAAGPPTPASNHQYLYVAFQLPSAVGTIIIRRIWLLAAFAAVLLGIVAVMVNTRLGQRIESWMATSVCLLVAAYAYPEAATLILAGLLIASGTTLAVVAGRWLASRRRGPTTAGGALTRSSVPAAATDLWPPLGGDASGTALAESLTTGSAES